MINDKLHRAKLAYVCRTVDVLWASRRSSFAIRHSPCWAPFWRLGDLDVAIFYAICLTLAAAAPPSGCRSLNAIPNAIDVTLPLRSPCIHPSMPHCWLSVALCFVLCDFQFVWLWKWLRWRCRCVVCGLYTSSPACPALPLPLLLLLLLFNESTICSAQSQWEFKANSQGCGSAQHNQNILSGPNVRPRNARPPQKVTLINTSERVIYTYTYLYIFICFHNILFDFIKLHSCVLRD